MDEKIIENFRCFRERQTVRLAPLTLLVGENSTGKTSFMAMIRALWDAAYRNESAPNFKEAPYDLGTFEEIAHNRGARGGKAKTFYGGFSSTVNMRSQLLKPLDVPLRFEATFSKYKATTLVKHWRIEGGKCSIECGHDPETNQRLHLRTSNGAWLRELDETERSLINLNRSMFLRFLWSKSSHGKKGFQPFEASPVLTQEDLNELAELVNPFSDPITPARPFAGAPVRSRPRRTYDPSRIAPDPEGENIPVYLANMSFFDRKRWDRLKRELEQYGNSLCIFDELTIRPLGKKDNEPFQIQVRKFDDRLKGPWRNLIDVGYGVSQVLPILIEFLRPNAPSMFLLQQPEVHLHPSAQAALGTILCNAAGSGQQMVVETHSDHLLDRIRMDVRDGKTKLRPNDVSILFFERRALDVWIHSIRLDRDGNVREAPASYRQFFLVETNRSIGIE